MNFSETYQVIDGWLNSPSHKANLLNTHYEDVGVAVLSGQVNGENRVVVVQMFGSPKVGSNSIVPKAEAAETTTTTKIAPAKTATTRVRPISTTTKLVTTSTTLLVTTTQPIVETTTTIGKVIGLETTADNNTPSLRGAALAGALKFGVIHKL